jgi:hypothetical protein
MAASTLGKEIPTVKPGICKHCKAVKPFDAFGPPREAGRRRDQVCIACRVRAEENRHSGSCRFCGTPMESYYGKKGWMCRECDLAKKHEDRKAQAEKDSRPFYAGQGWYRWYHRRPDEIADATWRRLEEQNAREAWRWWLEERAPVWWLAEVESFGRSSKTDAYRERYRNDEAFRQAEIKRIMERKDRRGRFDEHVRLVIRGKASDSKMRHLLGYGREELMQHLISRFTDGMTVEALLAGEIHIDHDEPVSWYDPADPEELKLLWRLENVQPLWGSDNCRKGARTMGEWQSLKDRPVERGTIDDIDQ